MAQTHNPQSTPEAPPKQPRPVWRPSIPANKIPMNIYRAHINSKFRQSLRTSQELQKWTVGNPQDFWIDLWDYVGLIPALPPGTTQAFDPKIPITDIPPFFENEKVRINYAENVLKGRDPHAIALIGLREGQSLDGEKWEWGQLVEQVRTIRSALRRSGIKEGDRVAALISTSVWSIAIFLAVASIGAIFTSIAPDLGDEGCISRLRQVEPSILFADSDITYKGRQKSIIPKLSNILNHLDRKPEVFVIPLGAATEFGSFSTLPTFLSRSNSLDILQFTRLAFSHPLYILYSSGTTGPPKCLVHSHGGAIIQHKKISILHNSLTSKDVVFQYSSTSWVLWNIMIGHFSVGATLITYDGSPLYPNPQAMLKILEHHKATYFGTSPRYLKELEATKCVPKREFDLAPLRMVTTGGSHLEASQYHWFYRVFAPQVHLSSVTGGTDLVTSWICSDPASPSYAGEMQMPALGHDIDVVDAETGASIKHTGMAGEQITRTPFPSMPVFMWGDEGNKHYKASYFQRFDFPCWAQHDWISFNPRTGGSQVHGRSDGVLNPSGIRFGSAEIYSITESHHFNTSISRTLCVGRRRPDIDSDESVFLFVVMRPGHRFTDDLVQRLRGAIRKGLSGRHVPRFIVEVEEIPVTVNDKKVEILVKRVVSTGEIPRTVSSTVANPACLEGFRKFYGLEEKRAKL